MNEKYIQALRNAIRHSHGCASRYVEIVSVKNEFAGQMLWGGDVAIFDLAGHPKASQCYAWGFQRPRIGKEHHKRIKTAGLSPAVTLGATGTSLNRH